MAEWVLIAFVVGAVVAGSLAAIGAFVAITARPGEGERCGEKIPEPPKYNDSDHRFRMWLHHFEDNYRIASKTKGAQSQVELAVIVAIQMVRNSFERIKAGGE